MTLQTFHHCCHHTQIHHAFLAPTSLTSPREGLGGPLGHTHVLWGLVNCHWVPYSVTDNTACHSYCKSVQQITLPKPLTTPASCIDYFFKPIPRKILLTISNNHILWISKPLGTTTPLPAIHVPPIHVPPAHMPHVHVPPAHMPPVHAPLVCMPLALCGGVVPLPPD